MVCGIQSTPRFLYINNQTIDQSINFPYYVVEPSTRLQDITVIRVGRYCDGSHRELAKHR